MVPASRLLWHLSHPTHQHPTLWLPYSSTTPETNSTLRLVWTQSPGARGRAGDDKECCNSKYLLSRSRCVSKQAVHSLFQTPWKTPGKTHSKLWHDDRSFSSACKTVFFFFQLPREFLVRRGSRQWCPIALPLQNLCLAVFPGHLPVT